MSRREGKIFVLAGNPRACRIGSAIGAR